MSRFLIQTPRGRRTSCAVWLLAAFLAGLAGEPARAAVGPVPQWIWVDAFPRKGQTARFRRAFHLKGQPQKAALSGLADDRMTVFFNGVEVAEIAGTKHETPVDVAQHLKDGANLLVVEAHNIRGPAGILLRLKIVDAAGHESVITTDPLWSASEQTDQHSPQQAEVQRPLPSREKAVGRQAEANQQVAAQSPGEGKGEGEGKTPEPRWRPAHSLGLLGVQPWGQPEGEHDDYDQWKQALGAAQTVEAASVQVIPGFEIELVKSAAREEGSWISMAFDPQGRLTISREGRRDDKGLLRLTLPSKADEAIQVETINDTLEECRGLLYAHGALYANANNSRGLYRLRDTDGDDQFDEVKLLLATGGGVGHGRNDLALGPDGYIYTIHGNNVLLPENLSREKSPFRNFGPDRLRPCFWDRMMFDAGVEPPAGHVLRIDPEGTTVELMAGGFRNAYGLDFNADGELFTYDADMEWDVGAPWYKPTRINHIVPGGEYGYRQGTANRPAWLPDNMPSNLDIGLGSPTAVKFGTKSNFPAEYRRALFALDWSYGRIYAIHLIRSGGSFACRAERFVEGRPLNVTDVDFGPDGHMYFITGGRDTQSGLYRVKYVGGAPEEGSQEIPEPIVAGAEGFLDDWSNVSQSHGQAVRLLMEAQPVDEWNELALKEKNPQAAWPGLLALARVGPPEVQPALVKRLNEWLSSEGQGEANAAPHPAAAPPPSPTRGEGRIHMLTPEQQVMAVRCYALSFARQGRPAADVAAAARERLESLYPAEYSQVNQQLCELLAYLESPQLAPKTLDLLDEAETTEDRLCYLFTLRNVRIGWTPELQQRYFRALREAEIITGSVYMPTFVSYIRSEAEAWLDDADRAALGDLVLAAPADEPQEAPPARPLVREWKMDDLLDSLDAAGQGRSFERGRALYAAALCARCHKLAEQGRPQGPELSAVGKRFNRRDILESIVNPSKVVDEKYRVSVLQTRDGETITGRIVGGSETTLIVSPDPLDPRKQQRVALADIESQSTSPISQMPAGLLNTLTLEEILDLLAFVQSGGDPQHPSFEARP